MQLHSDALYTQPGWNFVQTQLSCSQNHLDVDVVVVFLNMVE